MFTGIIQATGKIIGINALKQSGENGLCLVVYPGSMDMSDVSIGDSISVSGVCLTVTELPDSLFTVDVSPETLSCTCGLNKIDQPVNLEKAMRLSDRLAGHLVSGHVDATGDVCRFEASDEDGGNYLMTIRSPKRLLRYITCKGSITVNGVSLTVNQVMSDEFSVNLIPHTLSNTTLNTLKPGLQVNLEVDMLARYVESLLAHSGNRENENQYR
ncbi:riboflavin synthase [Nitrosomonas sp. Nm51]|uniref:riboflavin synthase n=1 Tax=Nitrosomonas sp. Nm51 TaxID=133720 RepID=UPI0008CA570F|nr:riboflavin synthase [Nitrosomonas sp. Nm51]SER29573.1 riboflavin synthase [Nitrosomonas sp. Nm51]